MNLTLSRIEPKNRIITIRKIIRYIIITYLIIFAFIGYGLEVEERIKLLIGFLLIYISFIVFRLYKKRYIELGVIKLDYNNIDLDSLNISTNKIHKINFLFSGINGDIVGMSLINFLLLGGKDGSNNYLTISLKDGSEHTFNLLFQNDNQLNIFNHLIDSYEEKGVKILKSADSNMSILPN